MSQDAGFSFEYEVIKWAAMASFAKELNQAIVEKMDAAIQQVKREGLKRNGGCLAVAIDGLVRGRLKDSDYLGHLRIGAQGKGVRAEDVLAVVETMAEVLKSEVKCYSASARPMGLEDVASRELTRREAEEMARRLACEKSLGVLVLSQGENLNGNWGHVMSLIGNEEGVLRVDGRLSRRRKVTEVTSRGAANILRKGQRRKGLIIEI